MLAAFAIGLGSAVVLAQTGLTPADEGRIGQQQRFMQEADLWLSWVAAAQQAGDCEGFEGANEVFFSQFNPQASDFSPEWVRDFRARYAAIRTRGCTPRRQTPAGPLVCPRIFNADVERAGGACLCDATTLTMTGTDSFMWGTGVYTGDSHLCYAAVHAGVIPAGGGMIRVARGPGYDSFPGSEQNGHTSGTYGRFSWSISFNGAAPPAQSRPAPPPFPQLPAAPAPQSAARDTGGVPSCPVFYPGSPLQAAGSGECRCSQPGLAPVYGTGDYTADSDICRAAQHAGVIPAQGGVVRVTAAAGRGSYRGSTRNGVETLDWRRNDASFRVGAAAAPQPSPSRLPATPSPPVPPNRAEGPRCGGFVGQWLPDAGFYGRIIFFDGRHVEEGPNRLGLDIDGFIRGVSGGRPPQRFIGRVSGGRYSGRWFADEQPFGTIDLRLSEDARSFAGTLVRLDGSTVPISAICQPPEGDRTTNARMEWHSAERRNPGLLPSR